MMALSHPLLALLACLCLGAGVVASAQGLGGDGVYNGKLTFSPAEEALYLERYRNALSRGDAQQLYDPLEAIPGARPWKPLAVASAYRATIARGALQDAVAYAARNNSSALLVWRNGRIEQESYFGKTTATTPLNGFSLAKPITAIAVGRAIQIGKIRSLDQPVAEFIDEWKGDPRRGKILVRHLLDMRGGFLRQAAVAPPEAIMSRSFLHPRSDEILIREYPVVDEPGSRYEYNNAASDLVAILIERATGRRYAEFIGTEILGKIGALGGSVWTNRDGGVAHAGCCMLLPAETFLRLAILTLADGVWDGQRLLPESYVQKMTRATAENPHYGLGVYVAGRYTERRGPANPDLALPKTLHGEPYLADDLYLFDGNMNQVVYVVPSQRLVILRTGKAPPRSKDTEWDNARLPNLIMRGIVTERGTSRPQPRD
jgi:CubicO group peptidase (beta-lactamase class C family)